MPLILFPLRHLRQTVTWSYEEFFTFLSELETKTDQILLMDYDTFPAGVYQNKLFRDPDGKELDLRDRTLPDGTLLTYKLTVEPQEFYMSFLSDSVRSIHAKKHFSNHLKFIKLQQITSKGERKPKLELAVYKAKK